MDRSLVWRAALAQLVAVAALFMLLLALPLGDDFFGDYGAVIGPLSWVACGLLAGQVVALRAGTALRAALISGAGAALVGVLVGHALGLIAGVAAFGLAVAALDDRHRVPVGAG